MNKTKKLNVVSVIVAFVLLGIVIYFIKPTKLLTYAKAKFGVSSVIYVYEINLNDEKYEEKRSKLSTFFRERGISGTAYLSETQEYYVTLVPANVNPKTEILFGFKPISPEEFYKKMYDTKQAYFTRTLRLISN